MASNIRVWMPEQKIVNAKLEIEVSQAENTDSKYGVLGTIKISKGKLEWWKLKAKVPTRTYSWIQVADILMGKVVPKPKKRRSKKRSTRRRSLAADTLMSPPSA